MKESPTTDDALFKEIEHLRASCPGVNSGQILSWMKWQDEVLCRARDRIVGQSALLKNVQNWNTELCEKAERQHGEIAALHAQLAERDAALKDMDMQLDDSRSATEITLLRRRLAECEAARRASPSTSRTSTGSHVHVVLKC